MESRFTRFVDENLQDAFLMALESRGLRPAIRDDGAVEFSSAEATEVAEAAHQVRDAQFPWYLLKPQNAPQASRLRELLSEVGLRFFVELHESGEWLLVPRADQTEHDEIIARL